MIALWMAYSALIAGLAGLTASLLEPFARARRVPLRWLWIGALAASAAVTVAAALRPADPNSVSPVRVDESAQPGKLQPTAQVQPTVSLNLVLLWGWGLASFGVLAGVGIALSQLARLRRRARPAQLEGTPIALTQHVGPGAAPFGHPRIFVPAWAISLEQQAMHLLILHEREHLRAGDPRWLLAATTLWALMPWNLALWWCVRRLRCAMEIDCDTRVLHLSQDVRSYGELLLLVASHRSRPRLTALLTFAESSSPLERRIRTMTDRRSLHPLRASALGTAVVLTIAAACEAPRPEPVAPTGSAEVVASPELVVVRDTSRETRRALLTAQLKATVPANVLAASQRDPLLLVISPLGKVVRAARLAGMDEKTKMPIAMMGVEPDAIASIDVLKDDDWLPPEASGGVIYVKLKAEGSARDAGDLGALHGQQKNKVQVVDRVLSESEAKQLKAQSPLVEVRDANDRVVFSQRMESAAKPATPGSAFDSLPVDTDDIERVDVTKPAGIIRIRLKPGAKLRSAK